MAKLERVLGCTSLSQTALAVDGKTGAFGYLAGASIVINRGRRRKEGHLIGPGKNTFSCLAFSPCGQYVATGEFGHAPCVRIYELMDQATDKFTGNQVREMTGHAFGIVAVKFSPSNSQLISVGEHHDQTIILWNWKTGEQIASSKVTAQVHAAAISPDGSQCVTVGLRHVKLWSIGEVKGRGITGRPAVLGDYRNGLFVDVVWMNENRLIAVTEKGTVAELVDRKIMRTFHLENSKIYAICVMGARVLMGCNNGSVQSLEFPTTQSGAPTIRPALCLPHYLSQDVAEARTVEELMRRPEGAKFADVHAICCDPSTSTVTVAYADHSIYSWQEGEGGGGCRKIHSSIAHVGVVHAIEVYPSDASFLPPGSFLTGGADGTLRLWNMNHGGEGGGTPMKNLLSNDLKKMIILDEEAALVAPKMNSMVPTNDRFESGIKSIRVSRDGRHCAVGMRSGRLHVVDLSSPSMDVIYSEEAQEGDVMCVEYSGRSNECPPLLACGGRDRLVHLFLPLEGYAHAATIEDHSSAVIAIKFVQSSAGFMMYTCAADKMIIIWKLVSTDPLVFERVNQISSLSTSISDLHISIDGQSLLTACADRQLRRYELNGKLIQTVKATTDTGSVGSSSCTRMAMDHSGTFVASICSDRLVYIVEAKSGNPVAVLRGFGDLPTGIVFSADQRRLIISSSNGCIYVFRLSERIVNRIGAARKAMVEAGRTSSPDSVLGSGSETVSDNQPRDSEVDSSHFGSINSLMDDDTESGVGSNASVVVSGRGEEEEMGMVNVTIRDQDYDSPNRTFSVEDREEDRASSSLASPLPRYQSSKSMNSLRTPPSSAFLSSHTQSGMSGTGLASPFLRDERGTSGAGSPKKTRRKWGENGGGGQDEDLPFASSLDGAAMRLAPSTLPANFHPQQRFPSSALRSMDTTPISPSPSSGSGYQRSYGSSGIPSPYQASSSSVSSNGGLPQFPLSAVPSLNQNGGYGSQSATVSTGMGGGSSLRETLLARKQAEQMGNGGSTLLPSPPPALSPPSAVAGLFSRESPERVSLSKRYQMKSGGKEPARTAWSPSPSSTQSRRTISSVALPSTPSGSSTHAAAAAAAVTPVRRQSDFLGKTSGFHSPLVNGLNGMEKGGGGEMKSGMRRSRTMGEREEKRREESRGRRKEEDDSFSMLRQHIRSRSQSPNQLMMNGLLASSTPNGMNRGYERKDSDVSYPLASRRTPSRSNLRGGEEMRKSSQALDKISMARKLRQSTENLADLDSCSPLSRARSIGNLRGGGGQLEIRGGFEVEEEGGMGGRPRLSSPLSRNLARSMGQLNGEKLMMEGSPRLPSTSHSPSSGLLGAMSQLKKASNPDLADERLYREEEREEYASSPMMKQRRGAVQKKVERFHPRNRNLAGSRMESGSGESDSNGSEASPIQSGYIRKESGATRLDARLGGRRLGDSPRLTPLSPSAANGGTTPRRVNYLSQKMMPQESLEGPDLGSDESPRSSIMNGNIHTEWIEQFEGKPDDVKKLAHHLRQCTEEWAMVRNKIMHARRLIRESDVLDEDERATLLDVANNTLESTTPSRGGERERERKENGGNGQTRLSSASSQSSSFSSSHQDPSSFYGPGGLVGLLRSNMAKQN